MALLKDGYDGDRFHGLRLFATDKRPGYQHAVSRMEGLIRRRLRKRKSAWQWRPVAWQAGLIAEKAKQLGEDVGGVWVRKVVAILLKWDATAPESADDCVLDLADLLCDLMEHLAFNNKPAA